MPFGAVFGSLVFGVVATAMGWRLAHSPSVSVALSGVSLLVLGLALALGLLLQRPWARWTGLLGAAALGVVAVAMIVQGRGESLGLVGVLAAVLAFILLAVPKTGRFEKATASGRAGLWTSGVLAGIAFIALAGVAVTSFFTSHETEAVAANAPAIPAAGAPSTGAPHPPASARPSELEWHDFVTGMQKAKAAGKPMLVDFYATWCGPCKMMEHQTFHDANVIARMDGVIAVRVDSESEEPRDGKTGYELAEEYRVEAYPTIALLDADGRVLARFTGYRDPREFLRWLDGAIGKAGRPIRS